MLAAFSFFALAVSILAAAFSLAHGRLFRNPYLLVVVGIVTGTIGASLAFGIARLSLIPDLADALPLLGLGAEVITVLVSSMAGGLFVSALVIKSERLHEKDVRDARSKLARVEGKQSMVAERDLRLKEEAKTCTAEELRKKYERLRELEFVVTLERLEAEEKLKMLDVDQG